MLRTFFSCLHSPDKVVYETLEITNRIGDASSPVNLSKGGVEYRYDILHKVCSCPLYSREPAVSQWIRYHDLAYLENQRYEFLFLP